MIKKSLPLLPLILLTGFISLLSIKSLLPQKIVKNFKQGEEIQNQDIELTETTLAGYANKISVSQGEKLSFHVSANPANDFSIFVYREGGSRQLVATYRGLHAKHETFANPEYGLNWPANLVINVPENWQSGLYFAQLVTGSPSTPPGINVYSEIIQFIVKENQPGSTSKVLFQLPTNTWLAYNNRLGRSFYTSPRTFKSSFLRPIRQFSKVASWIWGTNEATVTTKEAYYIRWLEQNGYTLEFAGNQDIENKNFLSQYNLYISAGHDEYWSKGMRDNLEWFTKNGGNAIFFSSNSVYYQVRYEDNQNTVTTYKLYDFARESDPMVTLDPAQTAIFWSVSPVSKPENSLTGVGYRYGGVGKGGYKVYRTNLWPFAGTQLYDGAIIGDNLGIPDSENRSQVDDILAKEVDSTPWIWGSGGPVPSKLSESGTPSNFQILGINAQGTSAPAVMGMYQTAGGGTVFTSGSWDWWKGLFVNDAKIIKITKNLIDRLKNANVSQRPAFSPPGEYQVKTFRNGLDSYLGANDFYFESNNNLNNSPTLKLGNNQSTTVALKFDLSQVAPSSEIGYAQLSLFPTQLEYGSEIKAHLFEAPAPSGQLGPYLESEIIYQTSRAINFDVTGLAKKWINDPNTNNGVLLKGFTQYYGNYSSTNLYFASSRNSNQNLRPSLTIYYKGGGIIPPTPTPTATPQPTVTPTPIPTPTPTPIPVTHTLKIRAKGFVKNTTIYPKVRLYFNHPVGATVDLGSPLTEWTTSWDYQDYTYTGTQIPQQIDLTFYNRYEPSDSATSGTRSLYLESVTLDSKPVFPSGATTCFFDSGSEVRAFDGQTTYTSCPTTGFQLWNAGSFRFTNLP